MLDYKSISTLDPNTKICAHEGKDLKDATMYQQLVGSLLYQTVTRLDISYVGCDESIHAKPKEASFRSSLKDHEVYEGYN